MSQALPAPAYPAVLGEMKEFATFPKGVQRYIRCALDIALARADAPARWGRNEPEVDRICCQMRLYDLLPVIHSLIPNKADDSGLMLLSEIVRVANFDLASGKLPTFAAFRFLYERMLGAPIRPWLPAAFVAAAALPSLSPQLRIQLLRSISESSASAAGWSLAEPRFFPEWVDKVEMGTLA